MRAEKGDGTVGKLMLEIVTLIARVHDRILAFNAALGMGLTDKQLHFLISFSLMVFLISLSIATNSAALQ